MNRLGIAGFLNRFGRRQIARWGAALALLSVLAGLQPAQAANFQVEGSRQGRPWLVRLLVADARRAGLARL